MLSLEEGLTGVELGFNLASYPFTAEIDILPENLQFELIDMQSDLTVKRTFNSVTLGDFNESLTHDKFEENLARTCFLYFDTHIWERRFSCMKMNKKKK